MPPVGLSLIYGDGNAAEKIAAVLVAEV